MSRKNDQARMAETAGRYRQALDQADALIAAGHAEPDGDVTPALGAALAEPVPQVRVVHLSREELEQRKETLLGLLQVFELYTRHDVEENLAEVEYLLGGES